MSSSPVLPRISDAEIIAISDAMLDMLGNVKASALVLGYCPQWTKPRFISDLLEANVGDKYGVDIRALIKRIRAWNDAEFAGAVRMVEIFWQRHGEVSGWDEIMAKIRAELSPSAHERQHYAHRLCELRAGS